MGLTQTHHFCVYKDYCLIALISCIVQLRLIGQFYCFRALSMHDIIIYLTQWWEKCISKRSLIKHIFSSSKELYMTRSNFKVAVPSIVSRQSLIISKDSFILGQLFLKKTAHKYFSIVLRTVWFIRLL